MALFAVALVYLAMQGRDSEGPVVFDGDISMEGDEMLLLESLVHGFSLRIPRHLEVEMLDSYGVPADSAPMRLTISGDGDFLEIQLVTDFDPHADTLASYATAVWEANKKDHGVDFGGSFPTKRVGGLRTIEMGGKQALAFEVSGWFDSYDESVLLEREHQLVYFVSDESLFLASAPENSHIAASVLQSLSFLE